VYRCKEETYNSLLIDLKNKSKSYSTSTDGYDLLAVRPKNIKVGGKFNAVLTAKVSNTRGGGRFINYTPYKVNVTCEVRN